MQIISLINQSSENVDLKKLADVLTTQIQNHVDPVWRVNAFVSSQKEPGAWPVYILDYTDIQGAGGYHDVENGTPYAKVFIKTNEQAGIPWTIALSHEVLEMLLDPYTVSTVVVSPNPVLGEFVLQEICDPVEGNSYEIDGVPVSDFVYPSYYIPSASPPYDKLNVVTQPLQVTPNGYLSIYEAFLGTGWTEVLGEKVIAKRCRHPSLERDILTHEAHILIKKLKSGLEERIKDILIGFK